MSKKNSEKNNKKLVAFLKALAHPTRMGILKLLFKKEQLSVTEICENLDLEQSLTSHHLSGMRSSGVLVSSRSGKNIYYSISNDKIKEIVDGVESFL